MKKLLLLVLLTTTISAFTNENDNLSRYVGGAAGFSTGMGLSYRYWPRDYGIQAVFAPVATENDTSINLGIAGFKSLHNTKYTRLFIYLAANSLYRNYEENIYSDTDPWEKTGSENIKYLSFTAGIGPGIEIYIFRYIVIDMMIGFKYGINGDTPGLGFTGEFGIYYRF